MAVDWEGYDKSERNRLEYEEYENSNSEDDFKTWKLKRYVDWKITETILIILGVAFLIGFLPKVWSWLGF